jgi:hypothetical protein
LEELQKSGTAAKQHGVPCKKSWEYIPRIG